MRLVLDQELMACQAKVIISQASILNQKRQAIIMLFMHFSCRTLLKLIQLCQVSLEENY